MRQPVPFGKYLLLDRISVGGMAEVFKAKSYGVEGFEKIIAIKRILPTMGEDRDFIKMFIDEAKIAGQLAHANICQIFELGRIDGSHFIAMEYIWGKDLLQIQNRLRKIKQPMPVAMACFVIAKVLEGLDYAHRKRDPLGRPLEIVHRDCSPQNVLVSYEGEVKVIDFGIAKATSRNSRTMAGVLKGKFGYMSPEQVRGLPLDRRSDIFALGTMLYECLTGDRLFQGETDFSTLEKVRNVDIRRPRELNPNIPEAVENVILKALAKDVDDRYQWCSEMLADLQAFLMSQDVVFTAKSLSGWLKEVFAAEIDRERQQLEQYKRVGRDGLIAGVPAAAAKLDVVETLGEAGAPEGDATQLGGPDFEALENMVSAGAVPALDADAETVLKPQDEAEDEDDGEFGEEAPTEIFGDVDGVKPPSQPMPVAAPRTTPAPYRPSGPSSQPMSRPPQPPPRPPTASQPVYAGAGAGGRMPSVPPNNAAAATMINDADSAHQSAAAAREAYAQSFPNLANQYQQPPLAHGTPGVVPISQPHGGLAQPGQPQAKTLLGAAAPPGLPNYSGGYPAHLTGQQPAGTYPPPSYPSHPQMQQYPGQPSGQMPAMQQSPYHSQPGYAQSTAVPAEPTMPVEGKRKSSIGRDVAIGVGIAALVLGGFLAVKFLVLDAGEDEATTTTSALATMRLSMPEGVTAELFVDGEKLHAVKNGLEIPISAGTKKIKLVGPNNTYCEQEMKLPAGKVTTVECIMHVDKPADPGSAGSAAATGSAGAAVAATNDPNTKTVDKAAEEKAAAEKDAAEKAAAEKAAAEKAAAEKAAAEKSAAEKDAAEKDAAEKRAAAEKAKERRPTERKPKEPKEKDKPPVEDNPIDRIASLPSKGYVKIIPPPGAQVLVDGDLPSGSISKLPLAVGKHKITFVIGADKHTFSVMIKAGGTTVLDKKHLQ